MAEAEGAQTFDVTGERYDDFMGRYSVALADQFADAAGVRSGQSAIDVGCGPGALTGVLVERLGAGAVSVCDPSPRFLAACVERFPDVRAKPGRAESIPFDTSSFDHAMAQLVLHFVSQPDVAVREMSRVVRDGGTVSACVWHFGEGMEVLRHFWDAALAVDPDAPDEARVMRFGRPREIAGLFEDVGLGDVSESSLRVASTYSSFQELWQGFMGGVGPAGSYCVGLPDDHRDRVRAELQRRLGSPTGPITLGAVALCGVGRVQR